jgi:hypothetical protein
MPVGFEPASSHAPALPRRAGSWIRGEGVGDPLGRAASWPPERFSRFPGLYIRVGRDRRCSRGRRRGRHAVSDLRGQGRDSSRDPLRFPRGDVEAHPRLRHHPPPGGDHGGHPYDDAGDLVTRVTLRGQPAAIAWEPGGARKGRCAGSGSRRWPLRERAANRQRSPQRTGRRRSQRAQAARKTAQARNGKKSRCEAMVQIRGTRVPSSTKARAQARTSSANSPV